MICVMARLKWIKGHLSIWLTIVGDPPSASECCLQMQNDAPASLALCVPLLSWIISPKNHIQCFTPAPVVFLQGKLQSHWVEEPPCLAMGIVNTRKCLRFWTWWHRLVFLCYFLHWCISFGSREFHSKHSVRCKHSVPTFNVLERWWILFFFFSYPPFLSAECFFLLWRWSCMWTAYWGGCCPTEAATQMLPVFLSIMSELWELLTTPPVQNWRALSSSPLSKHCATCMWSPKCFLRFGWGKSLFILVSSHVALENRQCSALHSATIAISFFFPPSQQFQLRVRNTWCPQSLFMFSLTRPLGSVRSILWDLVSVSSCVLWWEVHITQIFVGFIVLA